jgi:DNA primase
VARVLRAANLATPEGRARAAQATMDVVREHPDPIVRDQYVMEVTGPTRMEAAQLRAILARPPVVVPAARSDRPQLDDDGRVTSSTRPQPQAPLRETVELEALRLLLQRRAEIAERLDPVLFSHGLLRRTYEAAASGPIHDVLEDAEPAVVDLTTRLAVEESTAEVVDVLVGLAVEAGKRAIVAMEAQARTSDDPLAYAPAIGGVKLMLEDVHGDEPSMDSLDRLLAWLTEHAVELEC